MEDERLEKIKALLEENYDWPSVYTYKFIVPTISDGYRSIMALFGDNVDSYTKTSKNGKYTSVTIKEVTMSTEEVLEKYAAASKIEGIVAL